MFSYTCTSFNFYSFRFLSSTHRIRFNCCCSYCLNPRLHGDVSARHQKKLIFDEEKEFAFEYSNPTLEDLYKEILLEGRNRMITYAETIDSHLLFFCIRVDSDVCNYDHFQLGILFRCYVLRVTCLKPLF
jgi:hypothetical protein